MASNDTITIVEVGPRDGLQYERGFFPTDKKIELINLLSKTGLTRIEMSSFVHPKVIPQFSDTVEVISKIQREEGTVYSALIPNVKGCELALTVPVDELAMFVSASETHNRKNVNMSVGESLAALKEVAEMGLNAGKRLRGYVVTAFGCPYEGRISIDQISNVISTYQEMGVSEVSLGDTTGMANPMQVTEVLNTIIGSFPAMAIAVHFHNSRGTGLANAYAAFQAGVRIFDSSVGGIGGCPTAIGAMGNIATEDLVNMMEEMGISTGINFDLLLEASAMAEKVIGTQLPSYTLKTNRPVWGSQ